MSAPADAGLNLPLEVWDYIWTITVNTKMDQLKLGMHIHFNVQTR